MTKKQTKQTSSEEEPKGKPSLNLLIGQINKKFGETVIGRIGNMVNIQAERISTGIPQLDEALGGGMPRGRMVEIFGLPSSGKSLIAQLVIANAQKSGGECVYLDAEGSFDPIFAEKLGVDTQKLVLVQSGIGEDMIDIMCKLLPAEPAVIVVDSVGSMITRSETEESVEKIFMAPKARLMSKGLPKLTALNKNTLIIFINQLRNIITTWGGGGNTTTGGMSLPFYASLRLEVKRDKDLLFEGPKTGHEPIGQVGHFRVVKNKTSQPFRTGSFKFFYEPLKIE